MSLKHVCLRNLSLPGSNDMKTTFLLMFNFPEILHISPNRCSVHSVDTECYRVEVIINELPSNMLTSVSYTNVTLSHEMAPSTFIISRTHDTVAQWLLRYEVMSTRPSCNEVLSVVNVFNTLMSPAWSSQFVIKRFSGPRWGFFPITYGPLWSEAWKTATVKQ